MPYQPNVKIKDVYVELKDYKFFHVPFEAEDNQTEMQDRYVGRDRVKVRIKDLLTKTLTDSGTYLITGFRGMGKTSVLRQSIADLNEPIKKDNKRKRLSIYYIQTFFGTAKRILWISLILYCVLFLSENFLSNYPLIVDNKLKYIFYLNIPLLSFVFYQLCFNASDDSIEGKYDYLWMKSNFASVWATIKIFSFSLIAFIIVLFLLFPEKFCDQKAFNFNCFESPLAQLPIELSKIGKFFVANIGLICSYITISLILYFYDIIHRTVFRFDTFQQRKKPRVEKITVKNLCVLKLIFLKRLLMIEKSLKELMIKF